MSEEFYGEIREKLFAGENILLHGPGGTGKSFTLRRLMAEFIEKGISINGTGTTGTAAVGLSSTNMEGKNVPKFFGKTFHSFFFGSKFNESPEKIVAYIHSSRNHYERMRRTKFLIIEEGSMLGKDTFEKADIVARRIRCDDKFYGNNPNLPFGGLTVIFSADFMQLRPVKEDWCFKSQVFRELNFHSFIFDAPERFMNDIPWFHLLQRVRFAEHTPADIEFLKKRVQAYADFISQPEDITRIKPTVLYAKKVNVNGENRVRLEELPGEKIKFSAVDTWIAAKRNPGYRDSYEQQADDMIPKEIELKVGAQVMLRVNLSTETGKVNGSRGVITKINGTHAVEIKWVAGDITLVNIHPFVIEDDRGSFVRLQIPVEPCWSTTINKSQGGTLDMVVSDAGESIFAEGQIYVMLSRVRTSKGCFLMNLVPEKIRCDKEAKEFVLSIERDPDAHILPPIVKVLHPS